MSVNGSNVVRIDEEYACPGCSGSNLFSPTYKQRKCTDCGTRGSESEFRTSEDATCPNCGDTAPKTHKTESGSLFTCRGCTTQFEG